MPQRSSFLKSSHWPRWKAIQICLLSKKKISTNVVWVTYMPKMQASEFTRIADKAEATQTAPLAKDEKHLKRLQSAIKEAVCHLRANSIRLMILVIRHRWNFQIWKHQAVRRTVVRRRTHFKSKVILATCQLLWSQHTVKPHLSSLAEARARPRSTSLDTLTTVTPRIQALEVVHLQRTSKELPITSPWLFKKPSQESH